MTNDQFDSAVRMAEQIAMDINSSTAPEAVASAKFASALETLNESDGLTGLEFLPADGTTEKLGFSKKDLDPDSLLGIYLAILREKLCSEDGDLRRLVNAGIAGVASSVMTLVVTTLALPYVAIPLAAALTGILLATGVEAFCRWSA